MQDIFNSKNQESDKKTFKFKSHNPAPPNTHQPKEHKPHHFRKHSPRKTYSPLAAFFHYPRGVSFINEDPEEVIVLMLRRHPITNVAWVVTALFMLILPSFFTSFSLFVSFPLGYQVVIILIWYLITTAFVFEEFLSWFFNVNIITDERILDVDFVNLIYREMTDAKIDQIQDVTVQIGGAVRTFFNYGDVIIQTAAQVPRIRFEAVPRPDDVARVLRELILEEEQEKLEGRVR
jgi:membrane protein YdbS with pleckstrin-like domain